MSPKKHLKILNLIKIILLVIILLLGVFFRFANLGEKIFWVDEVATAIRVSGYTVPEVAEDLAQKDIAIADTLRNYQIINSNKNFNDSFDALTKSPEHAPLYFILTRLWMRSWGSSIISMRSLSVCLSLLIFPCLYWLCQELFNKPLVSWLAVMLMSVSPFFVAYAQEARPYSLWTVVILLMGASFLRAIKINNPQSWILYIFSLIIGFYTSLFCLYIGFFQGIYLLLSSWRKQFKIIRNYIISSAIALLAFSPWMLIIINHLNLLQDNTQWMRGNFNILDIIAVFIGTTLLIFGDLPISQNSDPIQTAIALIIIVSLVLTISSSASIRNILLRQKRSIIFLLLFIISTSIFSISNYIYLDFITIVGALVGLCILGLTSYSLYFLVSNATRDRWLFIVVLIISLPIPLIAADIINQGQSSTAPRYLIPLQLGIQIAVAYCLANKLSVIKNTKKLWQIITVMFLTLGIFSCTRNFNLSPFYQKGRNTNNPAIAKIINQQSSSLVVVESDNTIDLLSLAYSLSPGAKFKVIKLEDDILQYSEKFDNIFILKPSFLLINRLEQDGQIQIQQVYQSHLFSLDEIPLDLWKLSLSIKH